MNPVPSTSPQPLDPSTPLFFDGEDITFPEPTIARFLVNPDELKEAIALACEKKTRDMVDRGYRAFARRHGWSEENPFRAHINAACRAGMLRRELAVEEEEEIL